MGSEDRKSSASANEQYQHIPHVSSPIAGQQGTPPGSERIEEPSYQEHVGSSSGQQPVEAPTFYPADLPDRQFQEEEHRQADKHKAQSLPAQSQQKNGSYSYSQGQQAYNAVPRMPVSLPQQGPVPYGPNPQYPPYAPNPPYAPHGQQHRAAPIPYTDPRAYQQPVGGHVQQPQPPVYPGYPPQGPGYPYSGYYVPYGYPQGIYPGYPPGYPIYPYVWYPPRPRRNGYQLAMAISSLVGSILIILGGLFCGIILLGLTLRPTTATSNFTPAQFFAADIFLAALMIAGIVGGSFGVFHSAVALASRPSQPFKLPPFWSFLPVYIGLVSVGLIVGDSDVVINNTPLAFSLIALSGILPALTFLALALQWLRQPGTHEWPTTWRRFTLALVSGATSAILLALVFEGVLTTITASLFGRANPLFIDDPNAPLPSDPKSVILFLIIISVIAPVVEEAVKPLAVIIMMGRIRSAAEAFILGMICGAGFDMIETIGYMSLGYDRWIDVAIDRSTAGLLHSLGAGMMALGWYYITHKDALKHNRIQIGLGCMLYTILQHAIWNGSSMLQLLPGPIGSYLRNGTISIVGYQLDAFLIVYIAFSAFMLYFLWFVTGKIRLQPNSQTSQSPVS
jgi:RsiW-degrading membrane proteinase PrsW (M82 family)